MKTCFAKDFRAFFALCFVLFLGGVFLLQPELAKAAPTKGFEALQVSLPKKGFTIPPGETREVMIQFKNIGQKTWTNTGAGFVSIYTYDPKYRVSDFRAENWLDYSQAALLKESSVAQGSVGSIYLKLKAPKSEGTYKETFHLAAEDIAWIPGGQFTLTIKVDDGKEASSSSTQTTDKTSTTIKDGESSTVSSNGLAATILLRSQKKIVTEAGKAIVYKVGIKNTGTSAWTRREIQTTDIAIASVKLASKETEHSSWVSSSQVAVKIDGEIQPGQLDFLSFTFQAPKTKGLHTVRYRFAANDTVLPDFYIDIPVEVTTGAEEALESPVVVDENTIDADRFIDEPIMRIGVLIVDEETDWVVEVSCNSSWRLSDGNGALLGVLKTDEMVRAFYKNQRYYFNRGRGIEKTSFYLRFVPDSKDAVCTIENFDRTKTRNAAYPDNQFRDILELRHNSAKDRTWMINELPVEEYLAGLAETSEASHYEFKKTLVTVARTYALYHWERATKHASEYYHLNSTGDDQVYNGYGYELRHPSIGKAAQETKGTVVTYDGQTAITPYFSRSDGRTRGWEEVWYGEVAWLKSVPTPCDAKRGYTLWGHGVGMAATEALCMANNGDQWDTILKYFYQGVELKRRWE